MPSTIGKCKLFKIKHITLLEGETFLRNKHEIAFYEIKCTFFGRKENTISQKKKCTFRNRKFLVSFSLLAYYSHIMGRGQLNNPSFRRFVLRYRKDGLTFTEISQKLDGLRNFLLIIKY